MTEPTIRYGWLRGMYAYTAAGSGLVGIGMLTAPRQVALLLHMPEQDPAMFGLVASAYVAFGLLGLLGLRAPLRFAPILLLQMLYKIAWIVIVFLPLAARGQAGGYTLALAAVFLTYVVGDLIAIPFADLLSPNKPL